MWRYGEDDVNVYNKAPMLIFMPNGTYQRMSILIPDLSTGNEQYQVQTRIWGNSRKHGAILTAWFFCSSAVHVKHEIFASWILPAW